VDSLVGPRQSTSEEGNPGKNHPHERNPQNSDLQNRDLQNGNPLTSNLNEQQSERAAHPAE
jgi:hypothetical protein